MLVIKMNNVLFFINIYILATGKLAFFFMVDCRASAQKNTAFLGVN